MCSLGGVPPNEDGLLSELSHGSRSHKKLQGPPWPDCPRETTKVRPASGLISDFRFWHFVGTSANPSLPSLHYFMLFFSLCSRCAWFKVLISSSQCSRSVTVTQWCEHLPPPSAPCPPISILFLFFCASGVLDKGGFDGNAATRHAPTRHAAWNAAAWNAAAWNAAGDDSSSPPGSSAAPGVSSWRSCFGRGARGLARWGLN